MSDKKLKILQAVYCLGRGGAEKLVIDISRELAKYSNLEVLLVSFDKTVDYEYPTDDINYKFCPCEINFSIGRKSNVNIENYLNVVKEFKPDIIHSHRYLAELITREYTDKGITYFTHCHDNIVQLENLSIETLFSKQMVTNFFEKKRLLPKYESCNNQFIAISNDTKKYFERVLPRSLQKNIHLMNNAIDFGRFNKANNKRELDAIRIINIGSFLPKKNQIFLLEILRKLRRKSINASLTFLGEGIELATVKQKAAEYQLSNYIEFAGNVPNVADYLQVANVYVHTATYEPFGLVLLEAMASGLPVVSLDGKGNRDIVKDEWNGYFIEEQNPELFAQKIISLMSDKKKYSDFSTNAVEFSRGYDIVKYVDRLLVLYKNTTHNILH